MTAKKKGPIQLGLLDKVLAEGWKSLSSKETGRIGGKLAGRRRRQQQSAVEEE